MKNIALILVALFVTACGSSSKFVYPSNSKNLVIIDEEQTSDIEVAVPPFKEERGDENSNLAGMYLVPLLPYGWLEYERPDAARGFITVQEFEFDASEDMAKAAARSLNHSGAVGNAYFTYNAKKDSADYILQGTLHQAEYKGKLYSYGLSMFGPLLWYLGLPAGESTAMLNVSFDLVDNKTGDVVWSFTDKMSDSTYQSFYYNFGDDTKGFVTLTEKIMNKALKDMHSKVLLKK